MKKIPACLLLFFSLAAMAQKKQFDIFSFTVPAGWKTEIKENLYVISKTDNVSNLLFPQKTFQGDGKTGRLPPHNGTM